MTDAGLGMCRRPNHVGEPAAVEYVVSADVGKKDAPQIVTLPVCEPCALDASAHGYVVQRIEATVWPAIRERGQKP